MIAVIGGACSLTGQPLDPHVLQRLRHQARVPGNDWGETIRHDEMGGLIEIRNVPSATMESRSPDLVFNGYLHNGPDLREELGKTGLDIGPDAGDSQVALAAYCHWGLDFVGKLLGEYALILWDAPHRRLLAARDALGLRDLFFTRRSDSILIASQVAQLTEGRLSLHDLDLEYVADFLASHTAVGHRSPIRGVERLPAASFLLVEDGRLHVRKHWEIDPNHRIRYNDEESYVEGFRHLFEEGIRRSVHGPGKVWTELSGGLDSSSIAGVAQEQRQREPGYLPDFAALSMVWPRNPDCDERKWQSAVVEKHRLQWHQVECDDLVFDGASEEARYRNEPHFGVLLHPTHRARVDLLRDHGVATLLSGARAEVVVLSESPPPIHLADLLRSFRLKTLASELSAWQKTLQEPLLNIFLRNAVGPLLNRRRMNLTLGDSFGAPDWIRDEFHSQHDMRRRAELGRMPVQFRSTSLQYQYEMMGRSEPFIQRGYLPLCVEVRHPFLYRPLVEYSMAIPWQMKAQAGIFKWLLRRAMRDTLPDIVRLRTTKRGPGPAIYRTLPNRWPHLAPLICDPVLAEIGVVDAKRFRQASELARLGSSKNFALFLGTLALEVWLRTNILQETPLRAIA